MNGRQTQYANRSDEALITRARAGDRPAFGELWQRHFRSGARVARQFTSSLDADDLVAEAFARIYQRVLAGGGPKGAFRPYLYTTIRNLASSWGAANREVPVDDMTVFQDPEPETDPAVVALDRTLTARAFRSLPERWQSVLWYTEVEGMDPHEVAPLLGMTANGVAALSYRAREGLRKAWLQAHAGDVSRAGECQWAISRIGDHAREGLRPRDEARMTAHLRSCPRCTIVYEEVDEVGARLALVLLPLVLGGVAGGTLLASLGNSDGIAAIADAIPALPETIAAGGAAAAGAFGFLTGAVAPVAVLGSLAVVAAASGGLALAPPEETEEPASTESAQPIEQAVPSEQGALLPLVVEDPIVLPSSPAEPGAVLEGTIADVAEVLDTTIEFSLSGTGTPGAGLELHSGGAVYASTTVQADGTFSLHAAAVPEGIAGLTLVQTVDRGYLVSLLGLDDALGALLDPMIEKLIQPLGLSGPGPGITIELSG